MQVRVKHITHEKYGTYKSEHSGAMVKTKKQYRDEWFKIHKKKSKKAKHKSKHKKNTKFIHVGNISRIDQYYHHNWYVVRKVVLKRDKYKCMACGSEDELNVHHKKYTTKYVWEEPIKNLVTLCRACHKKEHNII